MGWFSRNRDAIDALCESLTERWWEWQSNDTEANSCELRSVSGLRVRVRNNGYSHYAETWFGTTGGVVKVPDLRSPVVLAAVMQCLLNRQQAKKAKFADTANALADAIKAGDATAAIGLADWVKENLGETQ